MAADLSYISEGLRGLAVPLDSLKADPSNARKHSDKNLATIQASLARFGQRKPIVVNRRCYGIELEPKYCGVILERMSQMACQCELTN